MSYKHSEFWNIQKYIHTWLVWLGVEFRLHFFPSKLWIIPFLLVFSFTDEKPDCNIPVLLCRYLCFVFCFPLWKLGYFFKVDILPGYVWRVPFSLKILYFFNLGKFSSLFFPSLTSLCSETFVRNAFGLLNIYLQVDFSQFWNILLPLS